MYLRHYWRCAIPWTIMHKRYKLSVTNFPSLSPFIKKVRFLFRKLIKHGCNRSSSPFCIQWKVQTKLSNIPSVIIFPFHVLPVSSLAFICFHGVPNLLQCKKLVFAYGPVILVRAEKFLESTDICTALHACKATIYNMEARDMKETPLLSDF